MIRFIRSYLWPLLMILGACGGTVDAPSDPVVASAGATSAPASQSVEWTACTLVTDTAPADVCQSSQFVVERCTHPIPNPGGIECLPPKNADGTTTQVAGQLSSVWCCR